MHLSVLSEWIYRLHLIGVKNDFQIQGTEVGEMGLQTGNSALSIRMKPGCESPAPCSWICLQQGKPIGFWK